MLWKQKETLYAGLHVSTSNGICDNMRRSAVSTCELEQRGYVQYYKIHFVVNICIIRQV